MDPNKRFDVSSLKVGERLYITGPKGTIIRNFVPVHEDYRLMQDADFVVRRTSQDEYLIIKDRCGDHHVECSWPMAQVRADRVLAHYGTGSVSCVWGEQTSRDIKFTDEFGNVLHTLEWTADRRVLAQRFRAVSEFLCMEPGIDVNVDVG